MLVIDSILCSLQTASSAALSRDCWRAETRPVGKLNILLSQLMFVIITTLHKLDVLTLYRSSMKHLGRSIHEDVFYSDNLNDSDLSSPVK